MGKIAFVFSGQGAQYTGMGKELYESSAAAKEIFDMADRIRPNTSKQCFGADVSELSLTLNTQPCIFTVNLAAAKAVEEKGIVPDYAAGFSLGEISALAYCSVMSYEQAFKLVCKRAEFMNRAAKQNRGAMAAVMRLSPKKTEEICSRFEGVWPVNYNSPAQTVVAAREEVIKDFCEAVKSEKGKAVLLAVSGGFHSPLMDSAAIELDKYLEDKMLSQYKIPVYSNYTAEPYSGDYKKLISAQIKNPVKWQNIIENLILNGTDTFIEVGVGKTLTGLIKKINPNVRAFKVENAEDLKNLRI